MQSYTSYCPDHIAPLFLKLAADFISPPLTYLFNLSLITNTIPKIWKSAFVVPLSKGGDLSSMDNYRPISKLCILSKILENLVNLLTCTPILGLTAENEQWIRLCLIIRMNLVCTAFFYKCFDVYCLHKFSKYIPYKLSIEKQRSFVDA